MTPSEIRREIRELQAHMRENGIRRFSCFNGGHTPESYRCNARLFELKVRLDDALKSRQDSVRLEA